MSVLCKNIKNFLIKTGFEDIDTNGVNAVFTHSSYTIENNLSPNESYERLEFLGDAVLKLVMSDILYKKFPDYQEGQMTNIRSVLVSDEFLYNLAEDLDLKSCLIVSTALEKENGRNIPSISACAFEAFLGFLYEKNVEITRISEFLNNLYSKHIDLITEIMPHFNSKKILQEYTQKLNKDLPIYNLIEKIGSDNNLTFKVEVSYQNQILGQGAGKSKKQAEREAAYSACKKLNLLGENNE
jgi:ribonuclease-3